jgi:hypothetical protein
MGYVSHVGPSHHIGRLISDGAEYPRSWRQTGPKTNYFGMLRRSFLVPRSFSSITKGLHEYDRTTERGEAGILTCCDIGLSARAVYADSIELIGSWGKTMGRDA